MVDEKVRKKHLISKLEVLSEESIKADVLLQNALTDIYIAFDLDWEELVKEFDKTKQLLLKELEKQEKKAK